jgi:hypothetical protein
MPEETEETTPPVEETPAEETKTEETTTEATPAAEEAPEATE